MPVYTYTTLDDSSQATIATDAWGINATGQIVGYYGDDGTAFGLDHGFLYNPAGGTYATLDDPLAAGPGGTLGNNAMLAAYSLGQVGADWAFVTLGHHNRRLLTTQQHV